MKRQIVRLLVGLVPLCFPALALADGYAYLTVSGDNGTQSFDIASVKHITFDSSNMVVSLIDESVQTVPLAGLERMFFSSTNGMTTLASTKRGDFRVEGGVLKVRATGGAPVTLYNMKGMVVREVLTGEEDVDISLSGLNKGVYVVRVGRAARKIMNK